MNYVFRGTVLPVQKSQLREEARTLFTTDLSVPILATSEIYGSKLVAAMDRQHPRNLFDVRGLFARDGLTADVVECFGRFAEGAAQSASSRAIQRRVSLVGDDARWRITNWNEVTCAMAKW